MKTTFKKSQPKIIISRNYKYINCNYKYFKYFKLLYTEAIRNNCDESFIKAYYPE